MNRLLIVFVFVISFSATLKNDEKKCSELRYSLNLNYTIPEIRRHEKELKSIENFSTINFSFGYRKTPLKSNEKNQPKFFLQKHDEYIVEKAYYYNLPDSSVYAAIYEWKDVFRITGKSSSTDTFNIDKALTAKYLKCQFQKLTDEIKNKVGEYKEHENYGTIREWEYNGTIAHLNFTLEKDVKRLRLVIYKK